MLICVDMYLWRFGRRKFLIFGDDFCNDFMTYFDILPAFSGPKQVNTICLLCLITYSNVYKLSIHISRNF